jgi:hypothetical protein
MAHHLDTGRRRRLATLGVVMLACLAPILPAQSQPIYRCGPEGRSYSQVPCAEGRTVALADDTPSPHQQAAARAVARSEQALGDRMEHERLAREAHARPTGAVHIGRDRAPQHEPRAEAKGSNTGKAKKGGPKKKRRAAQRDEFRAVVPAGP